MRDEASRLSDCTDRHDYTDRRRETVLMCTLSIQCCVDESKLDCQELEIMQVLDERSFAGRIRGRDVVANSITASR